jgi:predicted small lipoprotein YifL
MRRWFAVLAVLMVAACGSSGPGSIGPSDVAVHSSDLPNDLVKCDGSGDMDTFLNSVKTKDPSTYTSTKKVWDDARAHGATASVVEFFSDSKDHCASIQSADTGGLSSATFPVVINFVIQFKDEASAERGYTTESIFGFSESSISSIGGGVTKGMDTGLSKNSIALTVAIGNESFYVAVWQNKQFMVILGVLNVDLAQSKKIATNENSRIK